MVKAVEDVARANDLPFWVVIGDENFPGRGLRSQIFPDR
jgi:hypothetical protein